MKQPEDNKTVDIEDIIKWPNGSWCFRYELEEYSHMSDDYEVISCGSDRWTSVVGKYLK